MTFFDNEAILAHLLRTVGCGDVVVFLSNGAFGGLPGRFSSAL